VIAAALTLPAYRGITQADGEVWVAYRPHFRMGFSVPFATLRGFNQIGRTVLRDEAALDAVVRHFTG